MNGDFYVLHGVKWRNLLCRSCVWLRCGFGLFWFWTSSQSGMGLKIFLISSMFDTQMIVKTLVCRLISCRYHSSMFNTTLNHALIGIGVGNDMVSMASASLSGLVESRPSLSLSTLALLPIANKCQEFFYPRSSSFSFFFLLLF